jgi:hypothetical protein
MEKTFNDFLDELAPEQDDVNTDTVVETEEVVDEPEIEIETPEDDDLIEEEVEETEVIEEITEQPEEKADFKAFAEMRVKLKETEEQRKELETAKNAYEDLAKSLGFENSEKMLEAAKTKELEKEAEKQNVPVEFLKRLKDLEEKDTRREQEMLAREKEIKENNLISTIDNFGSTNKLKEQEVAVVISKLGEDGFDYESLLNLPEKSINKLLNSYLPKEVAKQKEIEQKTKLKQELPLTPTDKPLGAVKEFEDDMFQYMVGTKRDF